MTALDGALRARLVENLASFERRALDETDLAHAAVATVVVADAAGRACFLLTRRASRMRAHAGQWALPGGRVDPGEDAVDAALRELHEELGADVGRDSVLGVLDDYPTRSGYAITPVVCWAGEALRLEPNPDEVSAVHLVPLEELDRPDSPRFLTIPESERPVIQLLIGDSYVHAPTAAVLYQLREVAVHGRDTRVAHLEQPVFAWR